MNFTTTAYIGNPVGSKKFTVKDTSIDQSKFTYGNYSSQNNPSVVNEGDNLSFNLSSGNAIYFGN